MTGSKLSWRVENPQQLITAKHLGRSIKVPGFGGNFNQFFYEISHSFKATLLLSEVLVGLVDSEAVVIQLEVDTREEEGWQEEVNYLMG